MRRYRRPAGHRAVDGGWRGGGGERSPAPLRGGLQRAAAAATANIVTPLQLPPGAPVSTGLSPSRRPLGPTARCSVPSRHASSVSSRRSCRVSASVVSCAGRGSGGRGRQVGGAGGRSVASSLHAQPDRRRSPTASAAHAQHRPSTRPACLQVEHLHGQAVQRLGHRVPLAQGCGQGQRQGSGGMATWSAGSSSSSWQPERWQQQQQLAAGALAASSQQGQGQWGAPPKCGYMGTSRRP